MARIDQMPLVTDIQESDVLPISRLVGGTWANYRKPVSDLVAGLSIPSVFSWGAQGDGIHDDTAAVQASITASGRAYFPGGHTYLVSSQVFAPSNTEIFGDGVSSIIVNATTWNSKLTGYTGITGIVPNNAFILNQNWNAASITDHDINVHDLSFQFVPLSAPVGDGQWHVYASLFRMVQRVSVNDTYQYQVTNGPTFLGCDDFEASRNRIYHPSQSGLEAWEGPTHGRWIGNIIVHTTSGDLNPAIEWTSSPTAPPPYCDASEMLISNNIALNGCIRIDCIDATSTASNCIISNNIIDVTGYTAGGTYGISIYGAGSGHFVTDNTIIGVANSTAIGIYDPGAHSAPTHCTVARNKIIGGNGAIHVTTANCQILDNDFYNNTAPIPILSTGANCIVRTGNMPTGSGGRVTNSGTNSLTYDPDITDGRHEFSGPAQFDGNVTIKGACISASQNITATGTTQETATPTGPKECIYINSGAGNAGIVLTDYGVGTDYVVYSVVNPGPINVYPPSGHNFVGYEIDIPLSLAYRDGQILKQVVTGTWLVK